jgi:tetratricopeptide (TPR) repeat protein
MHPMAAPPRNLNLVFGTAMALLAGCIGAFFYTTSGQPSVGPAAARSAAGGRANLPENHPSIESGQELMVLEEMSRKAPDNADYKTRIGNIYSDMGQYRKAIDAYSASLAIRPNEASVETDMATCFHQLGQHDKALEILEKVLRYQPNFTQALLNKGVVLYAGKNDRRGAIAVWEELLRTNPNLPQRSELEARINQLKSSSQ